MSGHILDITLDLSRTPWTDLPVDQVGVGGLERIGVLPQGAEGTGPVVSMLVRDLSGWLTLVDMPYRQFLLAARVMRARWGDIDDLDPKP